MIENLQIDLWFHMSQLILRDLTLFQFFFNVAGFMHILDSLTFLLINLLNFLWPQRFIGFSFFKFWKQWLSSFQTNVTKYCSKRRYNMESNHFLQVFMAKISILRNRLFSPMISCLLDVPFYCVAFIQVLKLLNIQVDF